MFGVLVISHEIGGEKQFEAGDVLNSDVIETPN